MRRALLIAVVGHHRYAKPIHLKVAEEVGREIAKRGGIVLTGGTKTGVPAAAAKGAAKAGGLNIGISAFAERKKASKWLSVPILTGMGFGRNQIIALSCDAMIVIGGGVGALTEMCYAYAYSKPIIVIKGLGGLCEPYIGNYMDQKKTVKPAGAKNPKAAVALAFKMAKV